MTKQGRTRRITTAQIERAVGVLADLTTADLEQLDGATRDEFAHVIYVLDQLIEAGKPIELDGGRIG